MATVAANQKGLSGILPKLVASYPRTISAPLSYLNIVPVSRLASYYVVMNNLDATSGTDAIRWFPS